MLPMDVTPEMLEATELVRAKMNKTVLEIAQENADDYMWVDDFPGCPTVITLLDVALASEHRWDVVMATLEGFAYRFPDSSLKSFSSLVKSENKRRFVEKWFFQDLKRFMTVERLINRFLKYQERWVIDTEYEAMQHWAKKYRASDGWPDPSTNELLKGIQGFDIVDIQYLLMRLGVQTVKPDNRLMHVFTNLDIPFEDEIDLISKGHELADQLGIDALVLDQMFW